MDPFELEDNGSDILHAEKVEASAHLVKVCQGTNVNRSHTEQRWTR